MNSITKSIVLVACLYLFQTGCQPGSDSQNPASHAEAAEQSYDFSRIISVGGTFTEMLTALDAEKQIIAVDATSLYPPKLVESIPNVGFFRKLSAEGMLSLKPSIVITREDAGPESALNQLEQAGVPVLQFPAADNLKQTKEQIQQLARYLDREAKAQEVIAQLESDMQEVRTMLKSVDQQPKPRVLFVYARGQGTLMVGGTGLTVQDLIEGAGGEYAIQEFEDLKPLTPEAVIQANPDIILLTRHGLRSVGGVKGVKKLPGVAETSAGANNRIHAIDDMYILGFGPRTGQAMQELARILYPSLQKSEPS